MNETSIHFVRIESINDNHNDNNNGNHWRYQRSQQHQQQQQQQQQQQNKKNTLQSSGEIIINNDDDNNNYVKIRRKRRNDEKTSQKLLIKNFPCDNNDTNTKTNTHDNIGNQIQSIDMKNLYKKFINFAYCDSSNSSNNNNNSNNRQNQNVNSVQIIVNNCNDSLIKNNNDNNTATIFGKPTKSNENIKIKIPTITTPKLSIFKYFHQQQSSSSSSMFSSTMDSVFRLFNCNHYFYNSLNVYDQNAATTTLLLPSAILQQSTSTYVTASSSSTNNNTNINSSNNNSNNKNGRIIINSTISKELSYDQNTKQVELLTINQRQSQQQKNIFSNFQSINHNNSDLLQILDNIWQITKLNQSLDLPSSLSIFTIKSIAPSHSHNNNINDNNSNLSNQNKVQQKSQNNLNNSRNSNIILKNISKHSEQQTLTNINANSSDLTSSSSTTKSSHTSSNNRNYQYNNNNNNKQTQKHQQLQQQNQVNNNNNNNINDIDENLSQELNKIDAQQQQQQQQQQQLSTLVVNAEECDESDDYQSSSSSSSSTSSTSQTHQHQQYYFEFLDEEIVDDISSYNNNNNYLAENNTEDYHPIFLHPQYRHLTLADKQRLERLFKEIDIDGNGVIDFNDLLLALEQKGIKATHENVKHLILRSDMNLDGDIDFAEFVSYCLENEKQLHVIFKDIDINSDGKIDAHELVLAFERAGIKVDEQEAVRLVRRIKADSNNSNQFELNFAEFRDYLLLHPTDSLHDLMRSWRFGTFVDLGEDGIMPVDFSETEIKTGMWWRHLLAGGVAGAVSRTSTAPLDRLKVFLQVRGAEFNGLGVCLRHMLQEGGVISLWRGNGINVLKIAPETAMKFMAFDQLKRMIHSGDPGTEITIMERFLAGSIAGAVSQTAIYPMEVLKTRFCLRQTGQYKGLFDAAQKIYSNGGIKNFYRGYIPNLIGIIPYAGIDLTIYETLKKMYTKSHSLEEAPVYVCLTCGTISSTFGQIASYPLALIRTRMQSETGHHRSSMIDMFRTIMKNEGPRGLYRGITANIMKVAPAVSISYVVYEYTRRPLGAVMT